MNKHIIITLAILASTFVSAQVAIGKQSIDGTSTILDFYNNADNTKGIILPALASAPTVGLVNGTFYYDTTDKKAKVYQNGGWFVISEEGNTTNLITNTTAEVNSPSQSQGVIIGDSTSTASGVLVLESPNKALILPKITSPESAVGSPYPGMICYDTTTKSLAIFDGANWNYWNAKS